MPYLELDQIDDDRPETDYEFPAEPQDVNRRVHIPSYTGPIQSKLNFKPEYYGLKINECDLVKHNITILELVKSFGFEHWVVGRDEALGKKGIPHYHIHFKSDKKIDALRKQKQKIMPQWGHSAKLYSPRKNADDWYCWAGYAMKEMKVGTSEMTPDEILEIDKHIHTQAAFKQSKIDYVKKKEEKEDDKKDLKTRLFNNMDRTLKDVSCLGPVAVAVSEFYMKETEKAASMSVIKSYVWDYVLFRKIVSHEFYIRCGNSTDFFSMYIS